MNGRSGYKYPKGVLWWGTEKPGSLSWSHHSDFDVICTGTGEKQDPKLLKP